MPENIPNNSLPSGESSVVDQRNKRTSSTVTHNCAQCGNPFAHRYGQLNKFCSIACSNRARFTVPTETTNICKFCGAEFVRSGSRIYTYCSYTCRGKATAAKNQAERSMTDPATCACGCEQPLPQGPSYDYGAGRPRRFLPHHKAGVKVDVVCVGCQTVFKLIPSAARKRTFCSRECYRAHAPKFFGARVPYVSYVDANCAACNKPYRIRLREKETGRHKTCSRACAVALGRITHGLKEQVCPQTQRKRFRASRPKRCAKCGYDRVPGILTIHHVDEDRHNWADDNVLVLCWNCHMEHHFITKTGPYKDARYRSRKVIKENFLSGNEVTSTLLKDF